MMRLPWWINIRQLWPSHLLDLDAGACGAWLPFDLESEGEHIELICMITKPQVPFPASTTGHRLQRIVACPPYPIRRGLLYSSLLVPPAEEAVEPKAWASDADTACRLCKGPACS
jgi:hypothetical protein